MLCRREEAQGEVVAKAVVLISGISGFIARHCAVEMLNAGYGVRGTVRSLQRAGEVKDSLAQHADVSCLEFAAADLESDAGWTEAAAGCTHVLHVASPFPAKQPKDEQELIRPAVQGTLRVLRAAIGAGAERFVQTSSMAAVVYGYPKDRTAPFTAADWTRVEDPSVTAYVKSKTLAERAAREYMDEQRPRLHYSSVNPGLVLGPALDRDIGTSADLIRMFLKGKYPGAPRMSIPVVDVRDVARMHRLALETAAPSGGRYLGAADCLWLAEIARAIGERVGPAARRVPTRELPDWAVKLTGLFDPAARLAVPELGKQLRVDTSDTRQALAMEFIPAPEAAAAMARSLIDLELV
jgi:dihydroflavonol-4-reductase